MRSEVVAARIRVISNPFQRVGESVFRDAYRKFFELTLSCGHRVLRPWRKSGTPSWVRCEECQAKEAAEGERDG